uniref:Uncharacterized protein n=1 Tax=Heliothis virescens TaxID=7102 RepID=A0A2A4K2J4_HELVI
MDETPKCSRDLDLPQKPSDNDETSSKEQSLSKEQATITIIQSITKDESPSPKAETINYIDQPTSSKNDSSIPGPQTPTVRDSSDIFNELNLPKYDPTTAPKNQVVSALGNSPGRPENPEPGLSFCVARVASTTLSYSRNNSQLGTYAPLIIRPSNQIPITTQPRLSLLKLAIPQSPRGQPQSLLLQALSKLNDGSLSLSVISLLRPNLNKIFKFDLEAGYITPPDSLTSAPPSYSFVLRQMAVRRRPRFMGTFYPSPSFVPHTPPPTYTTAFDVYIEPASVAPPPARVYTFGFAPMLIVCPECGYTGMRARDRLSARSARPGLHNEGSGGMAARVSAEGAGPSYASVLNFRGGDSNKENIEAAPGEVSDAPPTKQDDEEEEGFVPVISHGRRPGKGRRHPERRAPPRPQKAPAPQSEPQPTPEQQQQSSESQPKKFVEAPIPKVNPWQVRGGSTGVPPPAAPAMIEQEKRSPLQPQQQGRVQPEPTIVSAPAPPKPAIVKAPKHAKVNQKVL